MPEIPHDCGYQLYICVPTTSKLDDFMPISFQLSFAMRLKPFDVISFVILG